MSKLTLQSRVVTTQGIHFKGGKYWHQELDRYLGSPVFVIPFSAVAGDDARDALHVFTPLMGSIGIAERCDVGYTEDPAVIVRAYLRYRADTPESLRMTVARFIDERYPGSPVCKATVYRAVRWRLRKERRQQAENEATEDAALAVAAVRESLIASNVPLPSTEETLALLYGEDAPSTSAVNMCFRRLGLAWPNAQWHRHPDQPATISTRTNQ